VVASLLITVALFAFPALARLLSGGPQASRPPAVATTEGGVQGGTSSADAGRRYVVRSGDTLRSIAARFYGDERRWFDIYRANRKAIDDPDSLKVGATLRLP
jgi:nucleoid-associated protein YgaU